MDKPMLTLEPSYFDGFKFVGHDSVFLRANTRTISFESATRAIIVSTSGAVQWATLEDGKVTIVDATKPDPGELRSRGVPVEIDPNAPFRAEEHVIPGTLRINDTPIEEMASLTTRKDGTAVSELRLEPLGRAAMTSLIVNAFRLPHAPVTVPKIEITLKAGLIRVSLAGEPIGYVRRSIIREGKWVAKTVDHERVAEGGSDQEAVDKLVEDHVRRQRSGQA